MTETTQIKTNIVPSGVDSPYLRICVGTPTLGLVRYEWFNARIGQIIPVNWSQVNVSEMMGGYVPLGFLVADAQNLIVGHAVAYDFEWLLLYEDDVLPPSDGFIRINQYMQDGDIPVVSGLYFTKSRPSEPLVFRGRGNSIYKDWEMGDKVWCDGVPTGFLLVHMSIIKAMWEDCEPYVVHGKQTRRLFDFPRDIWEDPEEGYVRSRMGTSDLQWCLDVMQGGYFQKAGWPEYQEKEFPFLVDTNIFCRHINPNGEVFP